MSVGGFSLSDLCGCGSDCAACCAVGNPCSPGCGVPLTLYMTISGCGDLDGLVLTMTYDSGSGSWQAGVGALTCGGAEQPAGGILCMGVDCTGWFIAFGATPDTGIDPTAKPCSFNFTFVSCFCAPFELNWTATMITNEDPPGSTCRCCAFGTPISIQVTG